MQGLQVAARKRALIRGVLVPGLLGALLFIGAPASSDDTPPISELTGEAVGAALGLQPEPTDEGVPNCSGWFAEYEDGMGYCLAGTTDDKVEETVLAKQITGYERTNVVEAYAAALMDYQKNDLSEETAQHMALRQTLFDAHQRVQEQGKAD